MIAFDAVKGQLEGTEYWLCMRVPLKFRQAVRRFIREHKDGKLYEATIKPYREKRSLDANRLCWGICQMIAEAIGVPPEEVYRENVGKGTAYHILTMAPEAVERFESVWGSNGIGWFIRVADSDGQGRSIVHAFYGSSTYNTKEMHQLIDNLIQDAKGIGLEVMSERELSLIKEDWAKRTSEQKH